MGFSGGALEGGDGVVLAPVIVPKWNLAATVGRIVSSPKVAQSNFITSIDIAD
jgi:hypothetical protein